MAEKLTLEQIQAIEEGRGALDPRTGDFTFAVSFVGDAPVKVDGVVVTQDEIAKRLCEGRKVLAPPSRREIWTRSRIVIMEDGTPHSLLVLMAKEKYGAWEAGKYPFWKDKNYLNETSENIDLATSETHARGARGSNPYGAPAGTPEYWKAYRAANKDRLKDYHRSRRATLKAEKDELKARRESDPNFNSPVAQLSDRLEDIFREVRGETEPEKPTT